MPIHQVPSIPDLRQRIESASLPLDRYCLQTLYLTACRANELCFQSPPSDEGHTTALGPRRRDVSTDTYEEDHLLKLNLSVLKRRDHPPRIVALPFGESEPWTQDLAEMFDKLHPEDPLIPFSRQRLNAMLRRHGLTYPGKKNPLRHYRLTHLADYYRFDPFELTIYAGWTMGGLRMMGAGAPIGDYVQLSWSRYYPKLRKPLPS